MNWKLFSALQQWLAASDTPAAPTATASDDSVDARLVLDLSGDPTQPDLFDEIAKAQAVRGEREA